MVVYPTEVGSTGEIPANHPGASGSRLAGFPERTYRGGAGHGGSSTEAEVAVKAARTHRRRPDGPRLSPGKLGPVCGGLQPSPSLHPDPRPRKPPARPRNHGTNLGPATML